MEKRLKPGWVQTNIPKPMKIKLWLVMKDYPTFTSWQHGLSKVEFDKQDGDFIPADYLWPHDAYKALRKEIRLMPKAEVDSLPPDLRDWIYSIRLELLTKQPTKQASSRNEVKPYEETPHKQKMRELSRELAQIRLPSIRDSFRMLDAAPGTYSLLSNDFFFFVEESEGREIAAFADMEYLQNPNSDFEEADLEWEALFSHLKTGGLAEVIEKIEYFDSKRGQYSEQCHNLFTMVKKKIQDDTHLSIPGQDEGKPGFTPLFPMLIYEDAVHTYNGSSDINDSSYEIELLRNQWVLRCNGFDIYIHESKEKLTEYKELHERLRLQWVDNDKNQSIKNIAELHKELGTVTRKIKKDLLIFAGKAQLPGHCELC